MKTFHHILLTVCMFLACVPAIKSQTLICNQQINATTTQDGWITVTADMLLEGPAITGLEISLEDQDDPTNVFSGGDPLTIQLFNHTTFQYTVTDPVSSNSCWGILDVFVTSCVDTAYIDFVNDVGVDEIIVDVVLQNDQSIGSLQWTLEYDPTMMAFDALLPGAVTTVGTTNTNEFEPGLINMVWFDATSTNSDFNANETLFSLKFDVLENGTSQVDVSQNFVAGSIALEFANADQELICVNTSAASVSANGVKVDGNISRNEDLGCSPNNPTNLENWLVRIFNGSEEYFTSTDENGNYKRVVLPGDYTVSAFPYSVMWGFCDNDIAISLPNVGDQTTVDFTANAQLACSFMEVNISTPFLRRCFPNTYHIEYCNYGTADAENVYIEVELDEDLILLDASHPYTVDGQLVTFTIGTVGLECGTITMSVEVSCDAELGETHCTIATIYPQDPCQAALAGWTGPIIDVIAECSNDEVKFTIWNTGTENMLTSAEFIVVEDDVMTEVGNFQLNALSSADYIFPANGKTLRFNAEQSFGFPYSELASAFVEGCGVNEDGNFSTGFITDFSMSDYLPYEDVDCQENIGSYDPNDKASIPAGYGDEHYVKRNQTIDYKVRFQNTGTDTAFRVIVVDTISELLDMSTFKRTSFSHPHEVVVEDRTVSFIFNDINLVDSLTNEPASHGFVSFQIDMNENLSDGELIYNDAAIYFDFNEPIITNQTFLEIGTDFVEDASLSTIDNPENINVSISPNPATNSSTIYVDAEGVDDMQIEIYNVIGKLLVNDEIRNKRFDLSGHNLSEGTYLIRMVNSKRKVFSGKLIVH